MLRLPCSLVANNSVSVTPWYSFIFHDNDQWSLPESWKLNEIDVRFFLVRVFYCFLHILRAFTIAHRIFVRKIWPTGTSVRLSAYVGALGCGVTGCTADHPLFCGFFLDYKQDPSWSSMCRLEVSVGATAACIMLKHVPFLPSKSPFLLGTSPGFMVTWCHNVTCPFLWWQNLICFFAGWLDSARSSIHSILWWLSNLLFQRTWLPVAATFVAIWVFIVIRSFASLWPFRGCTKPS